MSQSGQFPRTRLSRLTLGTVQFGLPYGTLDALPPPRAARVRAMLDVAVDGGISAIDTARAYGLAESRIGRWLQQRAPAQRPILISKAPPIRDGLSVADREAQLRAAFRQSLRQLGTTHLDGYLVHRASDITLPGVAEALRALVAEGQIAAFGASVYTPSDARATLAVDGLSLLQAPFSIFDQRLAEDGALEECAAHSVVVFARSVYLQGVLFRTPQQLPTILRGLAPALAKVRAIATDAGVSTAALALALPLGEPAIASVVVGAARMRELRGTLIAANETVPLDAITAARKSCAGLPEELIDPRRWH